MKSDSETCCKNTSNDLELSEDQTLFRLCSEAGLRLVEVGQFFYALPSPRGKQINLYAENIRCLEIKKELVQKDGSKAMHDLDQSRTKVCNKHERYSIEVQVNLCLKIKPNLGSEL